MITKWQIVLRTAEREIHLGYSARKTKGALLNTMRANGDLVVSTSGLDKATDDAGFEWNSKSQSWQFGRWSVRFSGATENDHRMMAMMANASTA